MKTKEFVRQVEALGYEVSYDWGTLYIKRNGFTILDLDDAENWDIDTDYPGFEGMGWNDKKELMTIVSEYMLTDLIDRKEEKWYRLRKIPIPLLREASDRFYRKPLLSNYGPCTSSDITESFQYQIIFTESEIAQMDITGFEKIEVTE